MIFYSIEPEADTRDREADVMVLERHIKSFEWRHSLSAKNDLDHVGIDTCSALTVSTQRDELQSLKSTRERVMD